MTLYDFLDRDGFGLGLWSLLFAALIVVGVRC